MTSNEQRAVVYLSRLLGKVFKLLPMREDYDRGEDNHLYEYLENLKNNYIGAFSLYPELNSKSSMVEIGGQLAFLLENKDVPFTKWRSIILNSTKLIQVAIREYEEV